MTRFSPYDEARELVKRLRKFRSETRRVEEIARTLGFAHQEGFEKGRERSRALTIEDLREAVQEIIAEIPA